MIYQIWFYEILLNHHQFAFDPQKNSVEPFRRIGENTVLGVLDKHENECKFDFTKNNSVEAVLTDKNNYGNPKQD